MPGISDPALDEALDRLRFAPDEPAARLASSEAQKLLSDLVPAGSNLQPIHHLRRIEGMEGNAGHRPDHR
ncbi:hypothetical protein MASR2M79_19540 [Aminivibrio sp.]